MARVDLKNVCKVFRGARREEIPALTDLVLTAEHGELVVILGPSGCGKTTTLRIIAGLETPSSGTIFIDDIDMNEVEPQDRGVAMTFQRDALYAHLTVFENVAFGLRVRRHPPAEVERRVREAVAALGLTKHLDRLPATLSGGERQRIALARAIVREPKVLLLDEPLSNLDPALRAQMRVELVALHQRLGTTMVLVTHDHAEGMAVGHRVAVMNQGVLEQFAPPLTIYHLPANMFVAGFVGSPPMNFFRGRVIARAGAFVFQENNLSGASNGMRFELPMPQERGARLAAFAEGNVVLGVRPENIAPGEGKDDAVRANLERIEPLGAETRLYLNTGGHRFVARTSNGTNVNAGERALLRFDLSRACFFNPASGKMIV